MTAAIGVERRLEMEIRAEQRRGTSLPEERSVGAVAATTRQPGSRADRRICANEGVQKATAAPAWRRDEGEYREDEAPAAPFACEPCDWRRRGTAFIRSFHCVRVNAALQDAARALDRISFDWTPTFSELDRARERSRRAAANALPFEPLREAA